MNKPKWLEIIWVMAWLSPPTVVAAVIALFTGLGFVGYFSVAFGLILVWVALLGAWTRLSSSIDRFNVNRKDAE